MKQNSVLILAAAAALALAGCSSTPSKVDTGPIHARTFSFMTRRPNPAPVYSDPSEPIHAMVQQAITKDLAARGVANVATGGDVTVAYLLIIGNNASTTSLNDYFGYGEDATALHAKAQDAYSGNKNPNYFEAGTLLIDVSDPATHKLLKRGYASRPILRDQSNDARAARIQGVVDEILRDLRIGP